jgi:hypothetical protein
MLINLDDDIRLSPGALSALHRELADGRPKFVGLPTVPIQKGKAGPVERDIFNMIAAKRRLMGWPAPIGRINALTTSIFPTITNFEAGDDVFLSAFFFINRIPQYVISGPPITYNPPSSLFEYVRRTLRIRDSDRRIVELLPIEWRLPYLQDIIRPTPLQSASADDARWLELSNKLLSYAEGADLFSGRAPTLEETDLSSKDGQQETFKSDNEIELELELARLKVLLRLN